MCQLCMRTWPYAEVLYTGGGMFGTKSVNSFCLEGPEQSYCKTAIRFPVRSIIFDEDVIYFFSIGSCYMAQTVLNLTPQYDMSIYLFASVVLCKIFMVGCANLISVDQDPDTTSACVSCSDKTLNEWTMSGWMIARGKSSHRNRALTKDTCPRTCP